MLPRPKTTHRPLSRWSVLVFVAACMGGGPGRGYAVKVPGKSGGASTRSGGAQPRSPLPFVEHPLVKSELSRLYGPGMEGLKKGLKNADPELVSDRGLVRSKELDEQHTRLATMGSALTPKQKRREQAKAAVLLDEQLRAELGLPEGVSPKVMYDVGAKLMKAATRPGEAEQRLVLTRRWRGLVRKIGLYGLVMGVTAEIQTQVSGMDLKRQPWLHEALGYGLQPLKGKKERPEEPPLNVLENAVPIAWLLPEIKLMLGSSGPGEDASYKWFIKGVKHLREVKTQLRDVLEERNEGRRREREAARGPELKLRSTLWKEKRDAVEAEIRMLAMPSGRAVRRLPFEWLPENINWQLKSAVEKLRRPTGVKRWTGPHDALIVLEALSRSATMDSEQRGYVEEVAELAFLARRNQLFLSTLPKADARREQRDLPKWLPRTSYAIFKKERRRFEGLVPDKIGEQIDKWPGEFLHSWLRSFGDQIVERNKRIVERKNMWDKIGAPLDELADEIQNLAEAVSHYVLQSQEEIANDLQQARDSSNPMSALRTSMRGWKGTKPQPGAAEVD